MKTLYVCLLIMVIPLIGGCTEHPVVDKEAGIRTRTIQPYGPGYLIYKDHYYIEDSIYNQTLLNVEGKLDEIDFKIKDVQKILDVASKKTQISGDKDIRLKLEEIDMKLGDVRTALEVVSRKVPISGDVVKIVTYLRPKLNVGLDPNVLYSDSIIKMTFNITNLGEHSVSIGEPQLTLSTECIRSKDAIAGILSSDADYKLQWEPNGFYVAPDQTIKRVAYIDIRQDELKGRPLYYSLCIDAETEPEIVEVLSGLLFDSLETDKLYNISCASFTFVGEAGLSALSYPE